MNEFLAFWYFNLEMQNYVPSDARSYNECDTVLRDIVNLSNASGLAMI